jgi:hypothetical protein
MRTVFALILILMTLGACQGGPTGPAPARDPAYYDRHGGMCSPYASNCW